ncbi:right-handed parallel beta-helix repeat-containing protein [Agrilutibacter solisilvae]|uniref:Right handed beta helix domain-containing protein n=1 Tax=Agrilutibacter solisilvae TaxID=2763317 RepID=A0A975ASL8_9GAMM|nr:hypothetical protein [Lysobacter solisilvae]QSX79084.1 hypothetical protein I8J32_004045 [Lysobacter solisilvae]
MAPAARAAQDYASCTGYIDTLPATIGASGNWCLRANRHTSQSNGAAITIAADNVTLDCNDFRLSGGGATTGVSATGTRQGVTVRRCRIQGFYFGIKLVGDGHLVEDNTVDRSGFIGVQTEGDATVIRGNAVSDTGGPTGFAYGIYALAPTSATAAPTIVDNLVSGVVPRVPGGVQVRGIMSNGLVQDNLVNISGVGPGRIGILLQAGGVARGNVLTGGGGAGNDGNHDYVPDTAIVGGGSARTVCSDNSVVGFHGDQAPAALISGCQAGGENLSHVKQAPPQVAP